MTFEFDGKRILITGATGRVAGVIARELALAHDVVAVARFRAPSARARLAALGVDCVTGDLAGDLSAVPRDVDILLNFAVSFSGDWGEALAVNAEGLGHLVDHLPRLERMLHCSSMGVYASGVEPHLESDGLGDSNTALMPTYSISKIAGESMARYLAHSRGIPTTIARLATPYGGHGGLPWYHLQAILTDQPVTLHPTAPNLFNLIHEDDLVAGLPILLDAADIPAAVVNWGDPCPVAAEDWCRELGRLVGREPRVERCPSAPPPGVVDVSRLRALGYRPRVEWREGFRRMVAERHPDELVDGSG